MVGVDNFDPFYSPQEKRRNLASATTHEAFRLVEVDCADLEAMRRALRDESIDVVVHLAAKAGVRPSLQDPMAYVKANILGTQAVLELSRELGVARFVLGSSSSVYGNSPAAQFRETDPVDQPISPYAATKRAAELLAHTYHHVYGMGVLALRFFTVYGPRQRPDLAIRKFATLMLRSEPVPLFGDGSTERDYTWVDDIIRGVMAAVDRSCHSPGEFEVINLGGNRTTSLRRLVELLSSALGVEPRIEKHSDQPGDVIRTCADITKAGQLLGFHPQTTVEDGIPRFVAWLKESLASHPTKRR